MARAKRRRSSTPSPAQPPEKLAARGDASLRQGHFKEAVACFKQLVKQQGAERWNPSLAQAYLGRAEELADKRMYKEAVVLLENADRLLPEPLPPDKIVVWRINAQQYGKGLRLFFERETWFQANDATLWEDLGALAAILLLTDAPGIVNALPKGSPLPEQRQTAREALAAYCRGEDERADQLLRRLPLRSPFKVFRLILKSLILQAREPEKAVRLLDKISPTSPFAGLAAAIRCGTMSGKELVAALTPLTVRQQELAATLSGISRENLDLFSQLTSARSDNELITRLLANVDHLPTGEMRQICLNLMAKDSRKLSQFEKRFGKLTPFEYARFAALEAERISSSPHSRRLTGEEWHVCIRELKKGSPTADDRLKVALIQRHLAEREQPFSKPVHRPALELLEESLEYDPDDQATWLQVIKWSGELKPAKSYHQWVEKAVKRFPEESAILTAGLEAALQKNTFVKATRLAKKILRLDPINNHVRQLMIEAHLAHAWKKAQGAEHHLVQKEIDATIALDDGKSDRARLPLQQGLLALKMGEERAGEAFLEQARELAGAGLTFSLRLFLEAEHRRLSAVTLGIFKKQLAAHNRTPPVHQQVIQAVALIDRYDRKWSGYGGGPFDLLKTHFKKAAGLAYTIEELRLICRVLHEKKQFTLLKSFAGGGEKRWPGQPIFVYYRIVGQSRDGVSPLSNRNYDKLETAAERAMEMEDFATAKRIQIFLDEHGGMSDPFMGDFDPFADGPPPGIPFFPDQLERQMVEEIAAAIEEEFGAIQSDSHRALVRKTYIENRELEGLPPFGKRVLDLLIDKALDLLYKPKAKPSKPDNGPAAGSRSRETGGEQLELDLFE